MCFWTGLSTTQFETENDIPSTYFKEKKSIHAYVEKIIDGDTVRVRHLVGARSRNFDGPAKDHTIIVRLAAVDTPETAKRGSQGQKFSEEAKALTETKLRGRDVDVKLLSKDQYGRVIGRIKYKESYLFGLFSSDHDIGEELLREGLAVVYRQGGAQYDGDRNKWEELEKEAIKQKKGMWKNGKNNVELPYEFKKNKKALESVGARSSTL